MTSEHVERYVVQRYVVVPHTHWDREWYRPFEEFHVMLGHVVDGVLDTLEGDPEFTSFTLDGQAVVLEDYLDIRPDSEPRLRALISAGRIEVGPSYVLPDEFLVGGEPLVRNLLIGRALCERFGGRPSPAGYLPDSFGHPSQLPQILAGFGITTFLFTRGLGDEIDDLGIAFQWAAPDGTTVLALQQLPHYSSFAAIAGPDDAEARVRAITEQFGEALQRAGMNAVVLCNGTDHAPVQPEMPAVCAELQRRFPGSQFAIGQYGEYVAALETGELPTWSGELLGSRLHNVLRGVNSARLYLKQANERVEQRLLSVETLAAVCAMRSGRRFALEDVTFAWRELLKCQPHDSICGCSCDEVHRDMLIRYGSLERTLNHLAVDALDGFKLGQAMGQLALFNPLPSARSEVVQVDGAGPALVQLDGFQARTIALGPPEPSAPRAGERIQSDRFDVQVIGDGTLVVADLQTGRRFEGLHALEDEPDMGDLYTFCPVPGARGWRPSAASTRILSDGPLLWELQISVLGELPCGLDGDLRPRSDTVEITLTTIVRLVRASDRIEFETTVDNPADDHRLRVVFPVGEVTGPVRAEGQFAVVRRPLVPAPPRTDWCEPPDPTGHAIGIVALGRVALLTRGLPEYEVRAGTSGTELCLTLLRCVGLISRGNGEIATRPVGAGPGLATPEGQCRGRHVLEYALRLDADRLDDVALLRESQQYRSPLLALPAGVQFDAPIAVDGEVVFSCLKGAQDGDGLILRVFNPTTEATTAHVRGPVTVERVSLDESPGTPHPDRQVELGKGEIATLRLRPVSPT